MKVPVRFDDGSVREVECTHTLVVVDGKLTEVYRSMIFSAPVKDEKGNIVLKNVYVDFYPSTGEVKVVVVG
jgi:hypothetical protein